MLRSLLNIVHLGLNDDSYSQHTIFLYLCISNTCPESDALKNIKELYCLHLNHKFGNMLK